MEWDTNQPDTILTEGDCDMSSSLGLTDLYATQDLITFSAVAKSALGDLA